MTDSSRDSVGVEQRIAPGILRRLGSMLYDTLIVVGLALAVGGVFIVATDYPRRLGLRPVLQALLLVVIASYFIWFWRHDGQTVAMKTWRVQVVGRDGVSLSAVLALSRFLVAGIGLLLGGISLWWALFDTEKQFLHDRLLGTRLFLKR